MKQGVYGLLGKEILPLSDFNGSPTWVLQSDEFIRLAPVFRLFEGKTVEHAYEADHAFCPFVLGLTDITLDPSEAKPLPHTILAQGRVDPYEDPVGDE